MIELARQNKLHTVGIFIDLSKVFDTLDHSIMLEKLNHYGIRGIANNLLGCYLKRRFQYTNFDGENSEKLPVLFGVPQGSILGLLLFLVLYINDLMNCCKRNNMDNTNFILYADDTNIFVVGKTKEEAFSKANKVLENVHAYMKYNLLHINMEKCCFMNFQPKAFSESEKCSKTVPFVGNNHVSKAIDINGQKLKEV